MNASAHITPGALCCVCNARPATALTRLVYRTDAMHQDAMVWGGATCEECASDRMRVQVGAATSPAASIDVSNARRIGTVAACAALAALVIVGRHR